MKTILMIILIILPLRIAFGMGSANYKIDKDSINIGGMDNSGSASYNLKETLGEVGTGTSNSASYKIKAGYREMLEENIPTFTFAISSNTCALGTLSTVSVSSCNYNVTTTANAEDGYVTTILEDGNLRDGSNEIDDVADGAVTAGSEEYGIALTGTDRAFTDERAVTGSAQNIASDISGPISSQAVTVTHKASITSSTLAGSYSHIVTLISTGTF